jgi:hypothetical protein
MAPRSIGHRRRPLNPHNPSSSSRLPAGDDVPAGTVAVVKSPVALRCSKEQSALHTLIHQRHPTPSCGGHVPTAERTLDPARMLQRELDRRPGIREQPGSFAVTADVEAGDPVLPLSRADRGTFQKRLRRHSKHNLPMPTPHHSWRGDWESTYRFQDEQNHEYDAWEKNRRMVLVKPILKHLNDAYLYYS